MSPDNFKGIIELGNLYFKCIIFECKNDNSTNILSSSIVKSEGVLNGIVVNPAKASECVRSCIGPAEEEANVTLKKISVIFEQPEFLCTKLSKSRKINGAKIQRDDIDFLLKEGKKQVSLNDEDQTIIHIFNHNYIVDGKKLMTNQLMFMLII